MTKKTSEAARLLAQESVRARREKWGEVEFVRRMKEWGKLGGRPCKKDLSNTKDNNNVTLEAR